MQIDSLDGLRGIAVLFVILNHLSNRGFSLIDLSFSGSGKYGVYLFFTLSSFLLSLYFLRLKKEDIFNKNLVNYFLRRFFRIYPLFTIVLLLSLFFTSYFNLEYPYNINQKDFLNHLSLQEGKFVLWSISVEFKYYFILPVVIFIYVRVLKRDILLSFFTTVLFIILTSLLFPTEQIIQNDIALGPYLPIFLLGSLTALIHTEIQKNKLIKMKKIQNIMEVIAMSTFFVIIMTIPSIYSLLYGIKIPLTHFTRNYTMYGFLWSLFIFSFLNGNGVIRKLLSTKPIRFVGIISFSLYLWHEPIIRAFEAFYLNINHTILALIIILLTLIVSSISYITFEKPFSKIHFKL